MNTSITNQMREALTQMEATERDLETARALLAEVELKAQEAAAKLSTLIAQYDEATGMAPAIAKIAANEPTSRGYKGGKRRGPRKSSG
jgi:hypothetical protein